VNRYSLRVAPEDLDRALLRMLEWFPEGVQEESDGDATVLSGYALEPPAAGLDEAPVEDGWADRWREFHRPVRAGRLWIGPPWYPAEAEPVVIDPGHAFGTGAHGSTRAALELMQRLAPQPALYLGCGSGVLSIAALRLGFGPIFACDIDPLAVTACAENARRNGVSLEVARADALVDPLPQAPLWIANLQRDLLERLLARPDLPPLLLASGLLEGESVGGGERVVVDGWAAELVRP